MSTTSNCAIALAAITASTSFADVYNDGSFDQGPDNSNLDLISVEVTNDESNVFFSVTTREFADWTKYMVFVDSIDDSGADGNNNGWVRNVEMGPAGIDYFMGAWVDNGGGTALYGWDDAWSSITGGSVVNIDGAANTVTMSISLATLGLELGDSLRFEIGTTGGGEGDPATDLMNGTSASWGGVSNFGTLLEYTTVPAPGALSLLVAAGLVARRRRA
jgi:hypothetical protein